MNIIKNAKVTWVDILKPTAGDIEFVKKQHKFHPIILDELLHLSARTRVESHGSYLFLTYHLPTYDTVTKTSRKTEIDFLITKNMVITVHYEELEPINNLIKKLSVKSEFRNAITENTGKIVYGLIEEIIEFSMRQLHHIEENVTSLTKELFNGEEAKMLKDVSYAKRDILDYRIISRPQEIILRSLKEAGVAFWGQDMQIYLSDLISDHLKVTQHLENYREAIDAIESTNHQLLNAKSTAVMQKFTVLAFLTFPLALITTFFNVSAIDKFIHSDVTIFLTGFASVFLITVILLIVFKKKGWL